MTRFAKLIELDNDVQVLYTVNFNNDDDNHELVVRTDFKDIAATIKVEYKTSEEALNKMASMTKTNAITFRQTMERIIKDNNP